MGKARLLDCTLRDGAYLVDKRFGDNVINGIIQGLINAGINYIEIGFLQNEGFGEGKTVFKNSKDAEKFVPKYKHNAEFSVLADCSRYSVENLDDYTGKSFDIVRECFFKYERVKAMENCRKIKDKGYKVFVQPVDILGYSDSELLELIEMVNQIEPFCLSIVDTFGSMYEEDLQHVYSIINHNLIPNCKIGFHSHNNMQMSNALSQAFLRMSHGKREVIVDGTISGMGRGAGNTPTELIAQYMVSKLGYDYDMDALLDIIDGYMDNIRSRCTWGYTTPYFLAGCYSAHVNNLTYLTKKNSIRSRDIRYILNKMEPSDRKRYPYDVVEKIYLDYVNSDIDDSMSLNKLKENLQGKNIVVIAPGKKVSDFSNKIQKYIDQNNSLVITVNFIHDSIKSDYIYMSNVKRYQYWMNDKKFIESNKIITSNIESEGCLSGNTFVVSFTNLVKCGWEHLDNSTILLLRLLDKLNVKSISIAGLDGYSYNPDGSLNYAEQYLELSNVKENPIELNNEIEDMLVDFIKTSINKPKINFITPSRFESVLEK